MKISDNTVRQYEKLTNKTLELRSLLVSKLIKFNIINEDNGQSFSNLIQLVTPQNMNSVVQLNNISIPIYTDYFNNEQDIETYIKQTNITERNVYIIKRIKFYKNYLKARLISMGIDDNLIKRAKTLKDYILLLDKVQRIESTNIILNGENILYTYVDNSINFVVYSDSGEMVTEGDLEIYKDDAIEPEIINLNYKKVLNENGQYTLVERDFDEGIISLYLTDLTPITYRIRYLGTNQYMPSEYKTFSFTIQNSPLNPSFELKNITTTSEYYDENSTDDYAGYQDDQWCISINIKNASNTIINERIPFTLYLQDKTRILYQGETDLDGIKILDNFSIPYYSSDILNNNEDDINIKELYLILETELNDERHPDDMFSHSLNLYHHPIEIGYDNFTWYIGTDDIPETIPVYFYDEYTGERLNFFEEQNTLIVNDDFYGVITDYVHNIDINDIPLTYGENQLKITLNIADRYSYMKESYTLNKTITILSNFEILPEKTDYYYEGPSIYYKPKGKIGSGYQAIINGVRYTTNNKGLLANAIEDFKDIGDHTLEITGTNNINERIEYHYTSHIPFELIEVSYQRTSRKSYQLVVYDKDHVTWTLNNVPNINHEDIGVSFIASDNTKQDITGATTVVNSSRIIYDFDIITNEHTTKNGDNKLTININGYTVTNSFKLFDKLFELQESNELSLGNNTIHIKTYDSNISSITASILSSSQTTNNKNGDIFTLTFNLQRSGSGYIKITDGIDTENIAITIPKHITKPSLTFNPTGNTFDYGSNKTLILNTNAAPISRTISAFIYAEEYPEYNKSVSISLNQQNNSVNVSTTFGTDLIPGTYTLKTICYDNVDDVTIINPDDQIITINQLDPQISITSIFSAFDETD